MLLTDLVQAAIDWQHAEDCSNYPFCEAPLFRTWHNVQAVTGQWQEAAVWNSVLHCESLQRYYTFLGERLARRWRWLAQGVIIASSGAAVVLLAGLCLEIGQVLALIVAPLKIWSELVDYWGKSARSLDLGSDLSHLATNMLVLWFRLDALEAGAAEQA